MRILCTSPQLSPQTTLENNGYFSKNRKIYGNEESEIGSHLTRSFVFFLIEARKQSNEEKKISKKCS